MILKRKRGAHASAPLCCAVQCASAASINACAAAESVRYFLKTICSGRESRGRTGKKCREATAGSTRPRSVSTWPMPAFAISAALKIRL